MLQLQFCLTLANHKLGRPACSGIKEQLYTVDETFGLLLLYIGKLSLEAGEPLTESKVEVVDAQLLDKLAQLAAHETTKVQRVGSCALILSGSQFVVSISKNAEIDIVAPGTEVSFSHAVLVFSTTLV